MANWLWVIPLAAFFGGWWIGGRRASLPSPDRGSGLSAGYVEGLNYLLNEQPDRAIDVLVSMVEVDSETVETHLALGTLFRNQGEVDRAIRIHQNLIARPTLTKVERSGALMNLGLDYKKAGLNDRAVVLFEQLALEAHPGRVKALENLLEIYQYEKEWLKAIAVSRKLLVSDRANQTHLISHFYGELVEVAIANSDLRGAAKNLRQMGDLTPYSPRYLLLQLKLARLRGKNRIALRWLDEIISHCPDYRVKILDDLEACYLETGAEQAFLSRLDNIADDPGSGPQLVCKIADKVHQSQGAAPALVLLERQADRFSSLLLPAKILSLTGLDIASGESQRTADLINELVRGLTSSESAKYGCDQCGFEAKEHHWNCPGCGAWGSIEFKETN